MAYILEQYEICLLQAINCQLDLLYSDGVEEELRQILLQAISSGKIEEEQIKRLKELLLLFYEQSEETESDSNEVDEEFLSEWPEWREVTNAGIKRKILYLHHHLSNWLLIQNAVYQKQLMYRPSKGIDKILDPILGIDREY